MWQQPMNIKIKLLKKIRQLINNQKKKLDQKVSNRQRKKKTIQNLTREGTQNNLLECQCLSSEL